MEFLEIGPGGDPVDPAWDIMDMVNRAYVNIKHDARILPLPIEDNTYKLVYMSHVLEHIPWTQTDKFLKEIYRILKPGGSVEIWVPDLRKLVEAWLNPELIKNDGWYRFNPDQDPTVWFNGRLFTYGPGEENFHRAAFDAKHLENCLLKAGFNTCELLSKPRSYDHGWINLGLKGIK